MNEGEEGEDANEAICNNSEEHSLPSLHARPAVNYNTAQAIVADRSTSIIHRGLMYIDYQPLCNV